MIIAGSDSSGGAGIQADIKTVTSLGSYAMTAITAITSQNTTGVSSIVPIPAKYISKHKLIGIIFGGSGQGEAIAANRIKGIRAAVYYNGPIEIIELSRLHNNANILSIGARFVNNQEAEKVIDLWLSTDFEEGRHEKRVNKLDS